LTPRALSFELRAAEIVFDGNRGLSGLSLSVAPGETVAFVGPSGAGKTSALRLLNGMQSVTSGQVLVGDQALDSLALRERRQVRRTIGYVPQGFGLVPSLRVAQNVLAGRIGGMGFWKSLRTSLRPSRDELEEVHALLVRLGIGEKLFQRVDSLSGGEQQRVAIARALYQEPKALLADEPLSALDPSRARETLELLTGLAAERGLTLVLSLHDILLARELLPRLVGLRAGKKEFDCATGEIGDEQIRALYELEATPAGDGE
jgi:phosphonate transport system ATP-binding protein